LAGIIPLNSSTLISLILENRMMEKTRVDQLWTMAAASLRDACGNELLARKWKLSYVELCKNQERKGRIEQLPPKESARTLLHALGRGHALIKQAIEWDTPLIGKSESKTTKDRTRGILWRYVMAYCGWDCCTNSIGIQQATQEQLLTHTNPLPTPKLTISQIKEISNWIPDGLETDDGQPEIVDGKWINSFLGIRKQYKEFPSWLLGKESSLSDIAILALLRNVVAHGSLSPTKAEAWGLVDVYVEGVSVVEKLLENLLTHLLSNI